MGVKLGVAHGYGDERTRMVNSCSVSQRTWKLTKQLFFHLLDLAILNSYIIFSSCRSKIDHRKSSPILVQNLWEMSSREPYSHSTPSQRPTPQMSQIMESLHCGKETTLTNMNVVHFIVIFCFISGTHELFWKR
jgi:hypothetical protein